MKWIQWTSEKIYEGLFCRRKLQSAEVIRNLKQLYPAQKSADLARKYYLKKLQYSLAVLLAGCFMALAWQLKLDLQDSSLQDNSLRRNSFEDGSYQSTITARYAGEKEKYTLEISPRILTAEETETYYKRFCKEISDLIQGENESLQQVTCNLQLENTYQGYPFEVEWKSECPDLLRSSGQIHLPEIVTQVGLQAFLSYQGRQWEIPLQVRILSREDTLKRKQGVSSREAVRQYLQNLEEQTRDRDDFLLPERIGNMPVDWQKTGRGYCRGVVLAALAVSILIFFLKDLDLKRDLEKQRKEMQRKYPEIVYRLSLYLGAGMTVKRAVCKVAEDYEQRKAWNRHKERIYEEMLFIRRELETGMPEREVYEEFGKRTGVLEYIRLGSLLTQNLKKGSVLLVQRLQEEMQQSMTDQIRRGKQLGEEAETRLLLPMVLLLMVVMIMVVLPAFQTMGA